ncbi:MAG: cell division protein SepF [Angelakisella sp.]
MAFIEGFKKFMGMSPLDDQLDDEEEQETVHADDREIPVRGFGYQSNIDPINKLDDIDGMDSFGQQQTGSYTPVATSIGGFTREEATKVVNIHQGNQPQVVLVKPERFEDAGSIADHLQAKRTVVVNTDSVSQDIRRRLIDFLSGVAYAEGGTIKKASNTTFVITPDTVGVMGDSVPDDAEQETTSGGTYY